MFLPIGDSPNPRGTPVVNYALIAINVIVFVVVTLPLMGQAADPSDPLLQEYVTFLAERTGGAYSTRELAASISAYDLVVYEWGFRPAAMSAVTVLTSMFLHGGFMHLAGNMLFLWIYGDNVEARLGRAGYLAGYLLSGLAATALQTAIDASSNIPMVGASGAISGALGFYFVFFPRNTVKVLSMVFLLGVFNVPARIVLGFYLVVDNLLPFFMGGSGGGGVAHGAHIGGFLAGLAGAWILDRREVSGPRETFSDAYEGPGGRSTVDVGPATTGQPRDTGGLRETVAGLVAAGRLPEAAQAMFSGSDHRGDQPAPRDALTVGRWLSENGHAQAALSIFRRVLRDHPRGPDAADAHLGAGLVQLKALGRPTSAYQHFLDAIDLDPGGDAARVAREGIAAITAMEGGGRRR